mmetsp:Transcript_18689/g.38883  ORF Transcript_18689/g.38883 Transcript_18689/m.38883 type:complete len:234 (+) Transcript_18689:1299-2000(+)
MHVRPCGQNVRVTDWVSPRPRADVGAVKGVGEGTKLIVGDDLLEAELEVLEELLHAGLIDLRESSLLDGLRPRLSLAQDSVEHGSKVELLDLLNTALRVGGELNEGTNGSAASHGDLFVEFDVSENTVVSATVDVIDIASDGSSDNPIEGLYLILSPVQLGNVDEGRDGLLGGGGDSNGVEAAREEAGFNLHDALVNLADDTVALLEGGGLSVERLDLREVRDVLVEVASPSG